MSLPRAALGTSFGLLAGMVQFPLGRVLNAVHVRSRNVPEVAVRAFFAALFVALLAGGCAHSNPVTQPDDAAQKPQFHNRLRISENTDLVGV